MRVVQPVATLCRVTSVPGVLGKPSFLDRGGRGLGDVVMGVPFLRRRWQRGRPARVRFPQGRETRPQDVRPSSSWLPMGLPCQSDHPDFTQELPRKLLPTRAKENRTHLREKR